MTNYRLTVCKEHHEEQFNFCFSCGSALKKGDSSTDGGELETLTCSKSWVHLRIFLERHEGTDDDCIDMEFE